MRFRGFTFSLLSPLIGVHVGKNPISGQKFVHVAPIPFFGLDFQLAPYVEGEWKESGNTKVVGFGPIPLPGESRRLAQAREQAQRMIQLAEEAQSRGEKQQEST